MRSIQVGTLLLVTLVGAILGAACGVRPIKRGGTNRPGVLSYAQVDTLRVGRPAKEVVQEFGPPAHQLKKEGRVVAIAYRAENAHGKAEELRIALDEKMLVIRWTLAPREKGR